MRWHFPLFAMAAAVVLGLVMKGPALGGKEKKHERRDACLVAVAFVVVAGLVEMVQPFTGRSASMRDFLYGALGAVLGVWWLSRRGSWAGRERAGFCLAAVASAIVVGWPIVLAGQHSRQLAGSFPKLLVEEPGVNGAFWKAEGGAEMRLLHLSKTGRSEAAIQVTTPAKQWSGVNFRPDAGASDWSGHQDLVLQVLTDSETPFELGLKIEDYESSDHSSRFNHSIRLDRGRHEVRIAVGEIASKEVDVARIKRLALFVSDDEPVRSFVVERAFLE